MQANDEDKMIEFANYLRRDWKLRRKTLLKVWKENLTHKVRSLIMKVVESLMMHGLVHTKLLHLNS